MKKQITQEVLLAYGFEQADITPITIGNINETFQINTQNRQFILQKLNPIFGPEVHGDIYAVTRHLKNKGLATPELVKTQNNDLWTQDTKGGIWRVLTFVRGVVHSDNATPTFCYSAGKLLGQFHTALMDLEHTFSQRRPDVHNTARHLGHLEQVLCTHDTHPAKPQVFPVAQQILQAAKMLAKLPNVPKRIVHGDPKLNNVVFSKEGRALCLIDLDTLGPMSVCVELGDAFRSWCNVSGEHTTNSQFNMDCFEQGLRGYVAKARVTEEEIAAVPQATHTIALELAARFCADALEERYFAWDNNLFKSSSEHQLHRAKGQLHLAQRMEKHMRKMEKHTQAIWRSRG